MKNRVFIGIGLIVALVLAAASLPGEAQKAASRSKLDSLVAGAMKNADSRVARAEKLANKAGKYRRGSRKWFSLMENAKRAHRIAYNSLNKYKKALMAPDLKKLFARKLSSVTRRLVGLYGLLIKEYMAVGSRGSALKLLRELKKIDAKAVARLKPSVGVRVTGKGEELKGNGRTTNPRTRAGRRLTGEEARWLGRRGVNVGGSRSTTPRSTPTPRAPAPRGSSTPRGRK